MPVKFKVEKGRTVERDGEVWDREVYTLELEVPDPKDVENARVWAVKTIDGWLSGKEAPAPTPAKKVPEFDPEELMKHRWKGRKAKYGEGYEDGSLAWGWDYKTEFSKEVIETLSKEPLRVDKYELTLSENGKFVQTRKVKQ